MYPTPKKLPLKSTPTASSGEMAKQSETCLAERALIIHKEISKKTLTIELAKSFATRRGQNIANILPIPNNNELKVLPSEKFEFVETMLAVPGFIFVKIDRLSSGSSDNHLALTRDPNNRPAFTSSSLLHQPKMREKSQRHMSWTMDN